MPITFHQKDVARRGRERRQQLGLGLDEVAAQLRVSRKRLTEFERTGVGTLRRVADWARVLDMAPGELAFGAPNPHS